MALRIVPAGAARASGGVRVKICGLTRPEDVAAAVEAGAAYAGFVFFSRSPRHLDVDAARDLALSVPAGVARVALTVDAGDAVLDAILDRVPIDILQLHGSETPARVAEVRARYGLPVMKAVGVASAADLPKIAAAEAAADLVLVDAKPPPGAPLPGGNGLAFDWRLIAGRVWRRPWLLAGGLTAANVAQAIGLTGARQLDVSSGVEAGPGRKDPALVSAFLAAVAAADLQPSR